MLPQLITTPIRLILQTILGKDRYRRARSRFFWIRKHGLKYYSMWGYRGLGGGLTDDEGIALYDLARLLPNESVIVEIGSWLGKSAIILSRAVKRKKGATLFCVDPFNADGDSESLQGYRRRAQGLGGRLYDQFVFNLKQYGNYKCVQVLNGYSYDFSRNWDTPIDLLFIDGNHAYEAVRRDFTEWSPFVKPGGYIVMHDVSFDPGFVHQGPARVVKELVLTDAGGWVHAILVGFMFFACKALGGAGNGSRSDS